jgi:hypothetical protein
VYFDFLVISGCRLGGGWCGQVSEVKVHLVLVHSLRVAGLASYVHLHFLVISGHRLGGGWCGQVSEVKVHLVLVHRLRVAG